MLHPTQPSRKSYVENLLAKEEGTFVAVSDNIRTVPDQIAPWVPGGLFTLGTDGFWLQRHPLAVAPVFLKWTPSPPSSARFTRWRGKIFIERTVVEQAIKDLGVDPEKIQPQIV